MSSADHDLTLDVPAWVTRCLAPGPGAVVADAPPRLEVTVREGLRHRLVTVRAPGAHALEPLAFQKITTEAYRTLGEQFCRRGTAAQGPLGAVPDQPIRFWNVLPHIHADHGCGLDRYMGFNAGRFAVFTDWYASPRAFAERVATATAVGHEGDDLIIHGLAGLAPGEPIENPRQRPAYRYSRHYGPLPPCFARATLVSDEHDQRILLVGGTASVRGERSVFLGDLDNQMLETARNLQAVLEQAAYHQTGASDGASLDQYVALRAYYRDAQDRQRVSDLLSEHFPHHPEIELACATLCRPDLLIEIEGIAHARQPR